MQAMPMPDASMVTILLIGLSAKRRLNSSQKAVYLQNVAFLNNAILDNSFL